MEGTVWTTIGNQSIPLEKELVIGLDFGTSNSSVAIWRKDKSRVKVIKNTIGEKITSSRIYFYDNFQNYVVGSPPKDLPASELCVVSGIKSLLGLHKLEDIPQYFHPECRLQDSEKGNDKQVTIVLKDSKGRGEKVFTCEELIALILGYLRLSVLRYLQKNPLPNISCDATRVVIGVPAHFPEKKREILRQAAMISGFEDVHFMIESTAAAMAYGLLVAGEKYVLIFDMGGGTTDLTILYIKDGKYEIQYTYGQSRLGGEDIDVIMVDHLLELLTSELSFWDVKLTKEDFLQHPLIYHTLYQKCKECKEQLSLLTSYVFNYRDLLAIWSESNSIIQGLLQSLQEKKSNPFEVIITRKQLEKWIQPILMKVEQTVLHSLQHYRQQKTTTAEDWSLVNPTEPPSDHEQATITIDEVVLVGGSSQIPSIQAVIRKSLSDVGISEFLVKNEWKETNNSTIVNETEMENVVNGKDFCVSINPNYAVVEGLAVRGAILSGENSTILKDILMLDCLPSTIGLLLWNEDNTEKYFEPILLQGSKLPIIQRKQIVLSDREQKFVSLEIYEEMEEINDMRQESDSTMKYSYYLLLTCDVLIENAIMSSTSTDEKRTVEVVFTVDEESHFSYRVIEISTENFLTDSSTFHQYQTYLLFIYVIFLSLIYFFAKSYFPTTTNSPL